jgi:hypothetical protein
MTFLRTAGSLASIPVVLLAVFFTGCLRPDRLAIFQEDFQARVPEEKTRPVIVPEEFQPRLTEEPSFALPAEGPADLSVEQAILLVLQNNRDLQVRQINPVIAGTFENIERGKYDPELFAEFAYSEERATEIARSTETQFSFEGDETAAVAGVRQTFPTGTSLEATVEQDRARSNRTPEQQRPPDWD